MRTNAAELAYAYELALTVVAFAFDIYLIPDTDSRPQGYGYLRSLASRLVPLTSRFYDRCGPASLSSG